MATTPLPPPSSSPLSPSRTTVRTLLDRLSHHRLIQIFVGLAFFHALLLCLLQGEALSVSKSGVEVLREIKEASRSGNASTNSDAVSKDSASASQLETAQTSIHPSAVATPATTTTLSTTSSKLSTITANATSVSVLSTLSSESSSPSTPTAPVSVFSVPISTVTGTSTSITIGDKSVSLAPVANKNNESSQSAAIATQQSGFVGLSTTAAARRRKREERVKIFLRSDDGDNDGEDEEEDDDEGEDEDEDKKTKAISVPSAPTPAAATSSDDGTVFRVPEVQDVNGQTLQVTQACINALTEPTIYILRLQTMSTAFVFFEIWILILGISGVLYESVPHVATVAIAHFLALVYAIYQVTQTRYYHLLFHRPSVTSACENNEIIPGFWKASIQFEIAIAILEAVGSIALAYVVWKLANVLEWRTYRKIGADRRAFRAHMAGLVFEISLHLSAFFITAFQGIWLYELCTTGFPTSYFATYSVLSKPYEVFLGIFTGLVPIWLAVGYVAFKKQRRGPMITFLLGDLAFLGHCLFLTTQKIYMETQSSFRFLTFLGIISVLVAFGTLCSGIFSLVRFTQVRNELPVDWVTTDFPVETERYSVDIEKGQRSRTSSKASSAFADRHEVLSVTLSTLNGIRGTPAARAVNPPTYEINEDQRSIASPGTTKSHSLQPLPPSRAHSRQFSTTETMSRQPSTRTLSRQPSSNSIQTVSRQPSLLSGGISTRRNPPPAQIAIPAPPSRIAIAVGDLDSPTDAAPFRAIESRTNEKPGDTKFRRTASLEVAPPRSGSWAGQAQNLVRDTPSKPSKDWNTRNEAPRTSSELGTGKGTFGSREDEGSEIGSTRRSGSVHRNEPQSRWSASTKLSEGSNVSLSGRPSSKGLPTARMTSRWSASTRMTESSVGVSTPAVPKGNRASGHSVRRQPSLPKWSEEAMPSRDGNHN
ncbi:hypothetical protein T439DRAFT_379884 [Meredithblackwellia eburnea MCA 4105]